MIPAMGMAMGSRAVHLLLIINLRACPSLNLVGFSLPVLLTCSHKEEYNVYRWTGGSFFRSHNRLDLLSVDATGGRHQCAFGHCYRHLDCVQRSGQRLAQGRGDVRVVRNRPHDWLFGLFWHWPVAIP